MKFSPKLEAYRVRTGMFGSSTYQDFGAFIIPGPFHQDLMVMASSGDESVEWEHVSVSTKRRCPNWAEMSFVKDLFWDEEETVMQLHPPKSKWINNHEFCLHMWRPKKAEIPLPPDLAVGDKLLGTLK